VNGSIQNCLRTIALASKTGNIIPCSLMPNGRSWKADIFHAIGSQLISGQSDSKWIFPGVPKTGTASNVNKFLKNMLDKIESGKLPSGLTTHSFRRGSANEALCNALVALTWVIMKGSWVLKGLCTIFEYLGLTNVQETKVSRVLCGWKNPASGGVMVIPENILGDEQMLYFRALKHMVFGVLDCTEVVSDAILAQTLAYIEEMEFIHSHRPNHIVIRKLRNASRNVSLNWEDVRSFGLLFRNEFVRLNSLDVSLELFGENQDDLKIDIRSIRDYLEQFQHTFISLGHVLSKNYHEYTNLQRSTNNNIFQLSQNIEKMDIVSELRTLKQENQQLRNSVDGLSQLVTNLIFEVRRLTPYQSSLSSSSQSSLRCIPSQCSFPDSNDSNNSSYEENVTEEEHIVSVKSK
jgi:hypothetical protein